MQNFNKIKGLFFITYPAVLILNPKLANNFFIFLLILLSGYSVYLNKHLVFTFYEKFLLIFVSALFVSILFKNTIGNGDMIMLKRHLRWLIIPLLLGQMKITKEELKISLISVSIGVLGYFYRVVVELIKLKPQELLWKDFFLSTIPYNHRYLANFNIPQTAVMLGITTLILFYLASIGIESKGKKIYLLIISIISFIILLCIQSRGMLLTLFIVMLGLAIVRKEKLIRGLTALILVITIFIGYYFSNSNYVNRYESIGKDNSSLARIEVYKEACRIFKDNKITGVGFEGFFQEQNRNMYKFNKEYFHPHNMALKLLSETGIIGFISYYLFMGSIIYNLWKKYKTNKYYLCGILCVVSLLLYENIEVIFIRAVALPYLFFIIGINLNTIYQEKLKNI